MRIRSITTQVLAETANSINEFNTIRIDVFTGKAHILTFPCRAYFCENKDIFSGIVRGHVIAHFKKMWAPSYALTKRLKACGHYRHWRKLQPAGRIDLRYFYTGYGKYKSVLPTPIFKQFRSYKIKARNKRRGSQRLSAGI